jgi:ADP-heptose:LPS heptosyltransferase
MPTAPGRVLVMRGGGLGDFVVTLPALAALARAGWDVSLAGHASTASLAVRAGWVREVRPLDNAEWAGLFAPGGEPGPALSRYLAGFDLAVGYLPDGDGRVASALHRCGVGRVVSGSGSPPPGMRASTYFAEPVRRLGIEVGDDAPRLPFPHGEGTRAALHPGSGGVRKNWPPARWAEVVSALAERGWRDWLVIEGESDGSMVRAVREGGPAGVAMEVLQHPDTLRLADRLAECALWLGNDSGVGHLAAACGCRTVSVFGPTDPSVWAPAGERARVVRTPDGRVESVSVSLVISAVEDGFT